MKALSLAQQLAQLDEPTPLDFDPEGLAETEGGPDLDSDAEHPNNHEAAAREHYVDVGPSALRKLHESISDPKYDGVRVSRSQLAEEIEDEDLDESASEDNADEPTMAMDLPDGDERPVTSDEDSDNSEDEDAHTDSDPNEEEVLPPNMENTGLRSTSFSAPAHVEETAELSSTLKRAREEERKKGRAVARQLAMYDILLDARIRLQKCVSNMNRLPEASKIPEYLSEVSSRDAADRLLSEGLGLAQDLFELQSKLLITNEGVQAPSSKRRRIESENSERDWDDELLESSQYFSELEASMHPYLVNTLQKWSNKVLAIAPSALLPANNTKFSAKNRNEVKSAVALVEEALLDREKLSERTKVWRGKGLRIGVDNPSGAAASTAETSLKETNVLEDVFDDTDFYQSLLRDVIASRSDGAVDGLGLGDLDWRAAQRDKKRAKKASGTVDTRASKGRKLRFEVHEKLKNFMAPAPAPPIVVGSGGGAVWHEAQVDELFASLLGRGFGGEKEAVETESGEMPGMDIDVEAALRSGFRVFG